MFTKKFKISFIISISILMGLIIALFMFYSYLNFSYAKTDSNQVSKIKMEKVKTDVNLEEYVLGVVACEMPALYEMDALKAQAIAARTYSYYKGFKSVEEAIKNKEQCFITDDEMKTKWGNDLIKYKSRIKNAVNKTKGVVIKKDNKLFKTYYFSTSNGYTEDSINVFSEKTLTSVDSSWDKTSRNYEVKTVYSKYQLLNILGNFNNLEITKRNKTNHVEEIYVDNKVYTGVEFRKLLNLRSTDFLIDKVNNEYIFTTFGYGHGVGMSQYGANEMAKLGKNYEEILKYYYKDITFIKLNV